jgi:beta-lactam-binding protein with PASTA domain
MKGKPVLVHSDQESGKVIAQSPTAGASVDQGSKVTLKISEGPQPIAVPNVVGQNFDSASSQLLAAGFAVARTDVDSKQPKDTVVAQDPSAGSSQAPGTKITLSVSKGPSTSAVPDVTSQTQSDAIATLKASGFAVRVQSQPTNDQSQDGIVLTQDPVGGSQAPPGSSVTIVVGKFTTPTP